MVCSKSERASLGSIQPEIALPETWCLFDNLTQNNSSSNQGGKIMFYSMNEQTLPCHILKFFLQKIVDRADFLHFSVQVHFRLSSLFSVAKSGHAAFSWSIWHFCQIKQIYTVVLVHTMLMHCKLKEIIPTKLGNFCGSSIYFFHGGQSTTNIQSLK